MRPKKLDESGRQGGLFWTHLDQILNQRNPHL
jgi:hypothetical protein